MANWCDNWVRFTGEPEKVEQVFDLFRQFEADDKMNQYHYPGFINDDNSLMIDIEINNEVVYYRSRWFPNLTALIQIADHYGLFFSSAYEEGHNTLFGQAVYEHGHLLDARLQQQDVDKIVYNYEFDCYMYNGISFKEYGETVDAVLNDKIESFRLMRPAEFPQKPSQEYPRSL